MVTLNIIKTKLGAILGLGIGILLLVVGFSFANMGSREYILNDGSKTIAELCRKDTGVCNENVGWINLDGKSFNFYIYALETQIC